MNHRPRHYLGLMLLTACCLLTGACTTPGDAPAPIPEPPVQTAPPTAGEATPEETQQEPTAVADFVPTPRSEQIVEDAYTSVPYRASEPFHYREAMIDEVHLLDTTVEQVLALYGEPDKREEQTDTYDDFILGNLYYGSRFYEYLDGDFITMGISEREEITTPRGIRVGDTLDEVLTKFPQEHNYLEAEGGLVYGGPVGWEYGGSYFATPGGYITFYKDHPEKILHHPGRQG